MSIVAKNGYNFCFDSKVCEECKGNCCIGESGYIWVTSKESLEMANFLKIKHDEFEKNYLEKIGYKKSIKEKPYKDGFACVFFDEKKLQCGIYDVRPMQCRTFPFWDYFKTRIKEVEMECPGIVV